MARIRSIKPEFWEDELIAELSRDARLLFIATWNLADDEGRLRWSPAYIKANVFPYDEDLDVAAVRRLMGELEQLERVRSYVVEGRLRQQFAVVVNFKRHQRVNRPQDSALPTPPDPGVPPGGSGGSELLQVNGHAGNAHDAFTEHSVNDQGSVPGDSVIGHGPITDGREGKGREGKGGGVGEPPPGRKRPSKPIPTDWQPNDAHRTYAASNQVDVIHEAKQFQAHAAANDRRQVNWDQAFRQWLGNTVKWRSTRHLQAVAGEPPDPAVTGQRRCDF